MRTNLNILEIRSKDLNAALEGYAKLHDGLSEMIENGRLNEADIPDDYQWLVESLASLSGFWQ